MRKNWQVNQNPHLRHSARYPPCRKSFVKSQIKIRTANGGAIIGIVILEGCYFLLCSRVRTYHASGGGLNPSEVGGAPKAGGRRPMDGWDLSALSVHSVSSQRLINLQRPWCFMPPFRTLHLLCEKKKNAHFEF